MRDLGRIESESEESEFEESAGEESDDTHNVFPGKEDEYDSKQQYLRAKRAYENAAEELKKDKALIDNETVVDRQPSPVDDTLPMHPAHAALVADADAQPLGEFYRNDPGERRPSSRYVYGGARDRDADDEAEQLEEEEMDEELLLAAP